LIQTVYDPSNLGLCIKTVETACSS